MVKKEMEYVDFGLPSGNLWAKCNIGASSPDDAGLYFQWGDINGYTKEEIEAGKKKFNFYNDDYKFRGIGIFAKYNNTDW